MAWRSCGAAFGRPAIDRKYESFITRHGEHSTADRIAHTTPPTVAPLGPAAHASLLPRRARLSPLCDAHGPARLPLRTGRRAQNPLAPRTARRPPAHKARVTRRNALRRRLPNHRAGPVAAVENTDGGETRRPDRRACARRHSSARGFPRLPRPAQCRNCSGVRMTRSRASSGRRSRRGASQIDDPWPAHAASAMLSIGSASGPGAGGTPLGRASPRPHLQAAAHRVVGREREPAKRRPCRPPTAA